MEKNTTTQTPIKDEAAIRSVYRQLINSWNENSSEKFAALFSEGGSVVGFDGSQVNGSKEIQNHLSGVFADHRTARYVTIIREICFLSSHVGLLRSVVGMASRSAADKPRH